MGSVVLNGATSGSTTITPTDAVTVTCTLPSTGGTLQTSGSGYTTNGVAYATSTSALATGSALQFDGTNLAVGATPTSFGAGYSVITAKGSTSGFVQASNGTIVTELGTYSGVGYVGTRSNNSLTFNANGSEYMRLTTSGYLGIGTSSPNYSLTSYAVGAVANYIQVVSGATGSGSGNGLLLGVDSSGNSVINAQGAINLYTYVAGVLRTTIDSNGNLLVGVSSYNAAVNSNYFLYGSGLVSVGHVSGTSSGSAFQQFVYNATQIGSITQSGTTAVAYNTSSDQRLKTDLGQVTSTNVIDNTIVHDFFWKTDGTQSRGVFAQEAYKVIPQAVKVGDDGEEVEDQWQVDYSKYVPDLIVYCQQLNAEIQSLKAEVATLKGA